MKIWIENQTNEKLRIKAEITYYELKDFFPGDMSIVEPEEAFVRVEISKVEE